MSEIDKDEQFYRDTQSIAFPKLDDRQLALLEPLGQRRKIRKHEILYRAGQRDMGMAVTLSGSLEAYAERDGVEQILAASEPRDFLGDISMLTGTASLGSVRGLAEESEVLIVGAAELRKALAELQVLGEPIVRAFMMRRERLLRDGEFKGFRIVALADSPEGHRLDDFFDKNHVPHELIEFESEEGQKLCQRLNVARQDLPVLIDSHGLPLRKPSLREMAQMAGLLRPLVHEGETEKLCDLAIVGAGPAGLSAAVNAASEGLKTVVLESYAPGGQAKSSSLIENFFGFPTGISGGELTSRAQLQALRFGAKFTTPSQVLSLRFSDGEYPNELYVEGCPAVLRTKCVLISTGAQYRLIEAEGREKFEGVGVYYAATAMESKLCQDATVVVAGGGNSAGQATMFLSAVAKKVLLVIRGENLSKSMSSYLSRRVETQKNVEILRHTVIRKIGGSEILQSVALENMKTGERRSEDVCAVFSMIGATPCTSWLPTEIERDENGFVKTGTAVADLPIWKTLGREPRAMETSRPGVFAAGDVRSGSVKRCAAAVGEGGMAVEGIHQVLGTYS